MPIGTPLKPVYLKVRDSQRSVSGPVSGSISGPDPGSISGPDPGPDPGLY